MAFLPEPPATPGAEAIYAEDEQDYGYVMNLSRVWAHVPEVNQAFGDAVRAAGAPFSMRERGVMVTATASTIGDSYCSLAWGERLAGATSPDTAAAVLTGDDSALTERERALATWARRVAGGAGRTTAEDVDELRAAGWSDAEIASATVYIGLRMAFSTVNGALGAAPDAGLAARVPAPVLAAVTWGRPVDADHVARADVLVDASPEVVWQVLTTTEPHPDIMFGARTTTDWRVGSPITWSGQWEGRDFEDKGTVVEVEPPRRLVVTHFSPMSGQPDVPESYHRLTYGIEQVEGGTRVSLEQDHNPTAESAEHSAANWRAMLEGVKGVAESVGS